MILLVLKMILLLHINFMMDFSLNSKSIIKEQLMEVDFNPNFKEQLLFCVFKPETKQ